VVTGRLAADVAADPRMAAFVDDTGSIYAHVADVEVSEDYVAAAARVRVAFPQRMQTSTAELVLPPIGEDLVMLATTGTSPVGREIARIVPDAVACDGHPIFMPPELATELRWWHDAAARPPAARIPDALDHLGNAGSRLVAPAVDVLLRASRAELAPVHAWLRTASGPGTVLARAVLWRSGDREAAAAAFDVAKVPRDWLQAIGLSVAESDGERLGLLGPSRTVPLL
jgi:hypothetical protein